MRNIYGRQTMPHSYCNIAQKHIHLTSHITKNYKDNNPHHNKMFYEVNGEKYWINIANEKLRHIYIRYSSNLSGIERQKALEKFITSDVIDWRVFSG